MLERSEVFDLQEQREKTNERLQKNKQAYQKKVDDLDKKKHQERTLKARMDDLEQKQEGLRNELDESLRELNVLQEAVCLPQHDNHYADVRRFSRQEQQELLLVWANDAKQYEENVKRLIREWRQYEIEKERYDNARKDYDDVKQRLDEARHQQTKWETLFEEEKEQLLHHLYTWMEQPTWITFQKEVYQQIASGMSNLFEEYNYETLIRPVHEEVQSFQKQKVAEQLQMEHRFSLKMEELDSKRAEIRKWETMLDPEPERETSTVEERRALRKNGVRHVPFYAAIEFREHVLAETRNQIEGALREMGILDALILGEQNPKHIRHNRILVSEPLKEGPTLLDFLQPHLSEEHRGLEQAVKDVLQSIRVTKATDDQRKTALLPDGTYQLGVVSGHPPEEWMTDARYIGKSAREAYRKREIERLSNEREQLFAEKSQIESELDRLKQELLINDEWYKQCPAHDDSQTAFEQWRQAVRSVETTEAEAKRKNEQMKKVYELVLQRYEGLQQQMNQYVIPKDHTSYQQAGEALTEYQKELMSITNTLTRFVEFDQRLEQTMVDLETTQVEVDEFKGDVGVLEQQVHKLEYQLERLNERLAELGEEDLLAQIEGLKANIIELKQETSQLNERKIRLDESLPKDWEEITAEKRKLMYRDELEQLWFSIFQEEIMQQGIKQEVKEFSQWAKELVLEKKNNSLTKGNLETKLIRTFYQAQDSLLEYRMSQQQVLDIEVPAVLEEDGVPEEIRTLVREAVTLAPRQYLLLEYQGRKLEPASVLAKLEEEVVRLQSYLDDQDRELFHEIIVNNIGTMIRAKIYRAEQWVKKTAKHMEERDNSSGLTFSLRWNAKPAEYEDQIDTSELVQLLKRNSQLLTEEELEKIRQHFRSKIEHAKERQKESGFGESFQQLLRDILDYRKWFQFTLYYKRENEQKRELTNNKFFTFSGGEKAMAMYIPLFSAAHSRYQEARPEAPPIICLDEAFAGVDERNIQDMFKLIEELGFNYIMNSQALWGDYETVSSLSISELVRPKNANFVTVINYQWDGNQRHLLVKPEEQVKELSLFE